jgi:hypothetical protein
MSTKCRVGYRDKKVSRRDLHSYIIYVDDAARTKRRRPGWQAGRLVWGVPTDLSDLAALLPSWQRAMPAARKSAATVASFGRPVDTREARAIINQLHHPRQDPPIPQHQHRGAVKARNHTVLHRPAHPLPTVDPGAA